MAGVGAHGTGAVGGAGAHGAGDNPEGQGVVRRRKRSILPPQKVELAVEARNLIDRDFFSKSDPMCVLYTRDSKDEKWKEYDRTEVIKDCLNPSFVKKFDQDFFFEGRLYLRFEMYDKDSKSDDLAKHDPLGYIECTLSNVVQGSPFTKELKPLRGKKCTGSLTVKAEQKADDKEELHMQWCGKGLDKMDILGSSDPFLEFARESPDGSYSVVYRTPEIRRTLNPVWDMLTLTTQLLCNNDDNRGIKVTCYDWNRSGNHSYIGEFRTTVETIKRGCGKYNEYELINPTKSGHVAGKIILKHFSSSQHYSFVNFIQSGRELHIVVGVDFSLSNKDPTETTSLHYTGDGQDSPYSQALGAVLGVLQEYNTSCNTLAYGFGAKEPGEKNVKDAFPLNFAQHDEQCETVDEILQAYHSCVQTVIKGQLELSGPTNFAPLIKAVARSAGRKATSYEAYHVLLLLTDGELSDMPATREAIIEAAGLPISIIVIGIGDDVEGFEAIKDLDEGPVKEKGKTCCRDIVQFVPFGRGATYQNTMLKVAEAAREMAEQIAEYMHRKMPMSRASMFVQFGKSQTAAQGLVKEVLREIPIQVADFLKGKQLDNRVERKPSNRVSSTSI